VPIDAGGWDLDALEAAARGAQPTLAYLIPDFQNPTAALINEQSRRRAVRVLEHAGSHVVIDETFAELCIDEQAMPPPTGRYSDRVITIGSIDKVVWGGLRVGWIRADPVLVRGLASMRVSGGLASPLLEQLVAVSAFGRLDELVSERRTLAAFRRAALRPAIRRLGHHGTIPAPTVHSSDRAAWSSDLDPRRPLDVAAGSCRRIRYLLSPRSC